MKTKHTLILGSLLFVSVTVLAQDKKETAPGKKETQEMKKAEQAGKDAAAHGSPSAEEKAWMEYMTPGPMHRMLASANGTWNADITMWMAPDAPPTKSTGKSTNTMILGERYQETVHKGDMMGMPFEGRCIIGYDNSKKVFQSAWVDNMGSGVMFMEGKYDEASKSIHFTGKMVDPSTGKEEKIREVFTMVDASNQTMEMYCSKDGKEFKTMEIKYKKAAQ